MRSEGGPAALAGVALGHLVELYDFAVFAASASILAKVVTPGQGGLTSVFVVLAAALLVRPLGAVLVGRVADLTGRRIPFLAMTLLMLVSTAAVGLLPSAATAGVGALIGLTLLRLLQAFSVGGETSTSVSYLFELAPAGRRGLYGGVHLAAAAVGMALGIGTVLAVQTLLTPAQLLSLGVAAAVPVGPAVGPGHVRAAPQTGREPCVRPHAAARRRSHGGGPCRDRRPLAGASAPPDDPRRPAARRCVQRDGQRLVRGPARDPPRRGASRASAWCSAVPSPGCSRAPGPLPSPAA